MKRVLPPILISGLAISALWFMPPTSGTAAIEATKLAGARPVIDATQFTTLQAAIDALPPEGGVVRLPPGTFEIAAPLLITREDVLLEGSGAATHIKNVNARGEPALVIRPTALVVDGKPARVWRVQLANLRITGNDKSGHGILAQGVNELFVHGVTSSYHGGDGIHLDDCYEDPRVCNSLITYNKKTGLHLSGCHDIVVSGNQFEENLDALKCLDGFNLCMTGNCVDDHLGAGVIIENTYGSVVSGNMIEECAGAALTLDRDCYGITLSANVIAHNGLGIDLLDAHGCAVSANTFTINKSHALRIGPASARITVTGNNFSNSYVGQEEKRRPDDRVAAGLTLDGTSDVTVSGNLFAGLQPKALSVGPGACRRIVFSDNNGVDSTSEHAKLQDSLVENNLGLAPGGAER